MRRTTLSVLSALAILLSGMIVPEAAAQSRRDKEQTYVLEKPYEVKKLVPPTGKKIKNVILMIGDGMSLMHMYSAWTANRGKLWLDNSQYTGLSKTYCANRLITDSGAGGTALATGHKTNYHMVGVDPEGKPLESLATLANKKGLSSGIAVTCRLWDATPADFCCHNTDRDAEAEIVADYVNCGVDYVFGGGSKLFENRADGRDLFKELREKGYQTPRSWEELAKIQKGKVFCVTDTVDTPLPAERGDLLARASMKAIDLLGQNPEGFFLMVEGGKIDWACHANDAATVFNEVKDMDDAIKVAYEFYKKHPKETLIVVTADHETGGIVLGTGRYELNLKALQYQKHSADGLSKQISELRKSKGNKVTWEDMKEFLGNEMGFWKQFPISWEQEKKLRDEFEQSFVRNKVVFAESMYSKSEPMAARAKEVMDQISMVGWVSGGHSAGYVPVFAIGAGSQLFGEKIDNTEIPKRIAKAAGYK